MAVASIVTATGLATIGGLQVASAQRQNTNQDSLIDKLSSTFNLNKDEVQKVFDQHREQQKAEMEAKMEERLNSAVTNGKLTQEQANKIKAKQAELKTFIESQKDATHKDRHEAMKAKRHELKQWAKENNIPDKYIHFMHGRGSKHGGRNIDDTPPAEQES